MGFSSMMSAGVMGKLGDKVGNHRLLVAAQFYSVIIYLLCANASSPLQLGLYRFLFGLGTGALIPGVNALLSKMTPKAGISGSLPSIRYSFIWEVSLVLWQVLQ